MAYQERERDRQLVEMRVVRDDSEKNWMNFSEVAQFNFGLVQIFMEWLVQGKKSINDILKFWMTNFWISTKTSFINYNHSSKS